MSDRMTGQRRSRTMQLALAGVATCAGQAWTGARSTGCNGAAANVSDYSGAIEQALRAADLLTRNPAALDQMRRTADFFARNPHSTLEALEGREPRVAASYATVSLRGPNEPPAPSHPP